MGAGAQDRVASCPGRRPPSAGVRRRRPNRGQGRTPNETRIYPRARTLTSGERASGEFVERKVPWIRGLRRHTRPNQGPGARRRRSSNASRRRPSTARPQAQGRVRRPCRDPHCTPSRASTVLRPLADVRSRLPRVGTRRRPWGNRVVSHVFTGQHSCRSHGRARPRARLSRCRSARNSVSDSHNPRSATCS